jgi:hypothetical protein
MQTLGSLKQQTNPIASISTPAFHAFCTAAIEPVEEEALGGMAQGGRSVSLCHVYHPREAPMSE